MLLRTSTIIFSLLLLLSLPTMAQKLDVVGLELPGSVQGGNNYEGTIWLSAPAPEGGAKVILLPAHRLVLPDQVVVPEGESIGTFTFTALKGPSRGKLSGGDLTVSTVFNGEIVEWDGPKRAKSRVFFD